MSKDTRFQPGQSGNPKGRPPKPRRPNLSAFEIILDKRVIATVGGKERELTVEEVLQQQTLKDALAGKRMAIRNHGDLPSPRLPRATHAAACWSLDSARTTSETSSRNSPGWK